MSLLDYFFSFCAAEEVEEEKDEKLDMELVEELAVEGEPITELIVGLDTMVIKNTDIANNKGNFFRK